MALLEKMSGMDEFKSDFLAMLIRRQHYYQQGEDYQIMREAISATQSGITFVSE